MKVRLPTLTVEQYEVLEILSYKPQVDSIGYYIEISSLQENTVFTDLETYSIIYKLDQSEINDHIINEFDASPKQNGSSSDV